MNALQTLESFNQGGSGPLGSNLTPAQRSFLESQLSTWDSVHQGVTTITAGNGMVQQRVDNIKTDLSSRQTTLAGMMSNITDADMAKAAADLQMAQTSFAAAAQVFQTLKESSLINLLAIQ